MRGSTGNSITLPAAGNWCVGCSTSVQGQIPPPERTIANDSLEQKLQRELQLPRGCGRPGDYPRCWRERCCRRWFRRRGSVAEDNWIRRGEVGVVENVEVFCAELGAHPFVNRGVLHHREVEVGESGPVEGVAACIAECPRIGSSKRVRVKPLPDSLRVERAVKIRIDLWTGRVAGVAVACRVVTQLRREREPALQ